MRNKLLILTFTNSYNYEGSFVCVLGNLTQLYLSLTAV